MKDTKVDKQQNSSLTKLSTLRQNKGLIPSTKVRDISKAIDGYAESIDTQAMIKEMEQNSVLVNLIIDCSGSMEGTSTPLAREINDFASRQAVKFYKTLMSLTLFDNKVYPKFAKVDVKKFVPLTPWDCPGGTNIYDALISAIGPIQPNDANHILHLAITDGSNGRSFHSSQEVRNLISSRIARGEHAFLLYNNNDSYDTSVESYASELGITPTNAVSFNRTGDGIAIIFRTIEALLDGLRTTGTIADDWSKAIEAHASNPLLKADEAKYYLK